MIAKSLEVSSAPKISIVTAVYNARETVLDAVASVRDQSYPNIEFIMINGASDDGTTELLENQKEHFDVYLNEPDNGIYDALNKGISRASGDVIGFLHADDLFENRDVLSSIAKAFSDPSIDAVYGDLVYVSKNQSNNVIRYWKSGEFSTQKLKHGWMPPHPTFYVRRSVYEQQGAFDTSFRIAADYDCMLRFLGPGNIQCGYIPEVLVKMRVGGASNRSLRNIVLKSREDYAALKRNGVGGLWSLLWKNLSKIPQFFKHS